MSQDLLVVRAGSRHGIRAILAHAHPVTVTIGGESADRWNERKIIQEQTDFAHEFLMGLMNKVKATCTDELQYGGWFAKCILEDIYDEILCWITFNHITEDEAYISTKQVKVCTMVYTYDVRPEFKTPEFQDRMKQWVTEMIHELVRIRKVYTKPITRR